MGTRWGRMIVKLQRPLGDNGIAPWLLYNVDGAADFIDPTPELRGMMDGAYAYFEAEPTGTGWDIRARVMDQGW
jgi:hypothetical protein